MAMSPTDPNQQRARAKRTVLVLALVTLSIYLAFIAHFVLKR